MGRLPKSTRKIILRVVLLVGVLIAIIFLTIYNTAVLEPSGATYNTRLHLAANELKEQCSSLSKATEKRLFDPHDSLAAQISDLERLDAQIGNVRKELEQFRAASNTLAPHLNTLTSSTYQKGLTLKAQSSSTADQIEDVLNEYHQLLSFLMAYYPMRQQLTDQLASFNAISDLNILADQTGALRSTARSLEQSTDALSKKAPPRGFEDITAKSIDLQKRAATAYESLASSLFPPLDAAIYASARDLETITDENDALNSGVLDTTLANSPTLKGVSDLPEKIDHLKF